MVLIKRLKSHNPFAFYTWDGHAGTCVVLRIKISREQA